MKLFPTAVNIPEDKRIQVIQLLNQTLADAITFENQLRMAHWNSKGPHFIGLHKFYDEVLEENEESIDTVAERITALGGVPESRVSYVSQSTQLEEFPEVFKDTDVLEVIIDRCGNMASAVRDNIEVTAELGDDGTSDLYTALVQELDKTLYLLQAHRSV